MRKAILGGLLAATAFSVTAPAFAQRNDGGQNWHNPNNRGGGDRGGNGRQDGGQRGGDGQYNGGGQNNRPQVQQQAPVQQQQVRVDTAPIQNQQQRQRYENMRPNDGNLSQQRVQADAVRQQQFRDRQASDQRPSDQRDGNRDGYRGPNNGGPNGVGPNRGAPGYSGTAYRSGAYNGRDVRGDQRGDNRNGYTNRPGYNGGNWNGNNGWNNGSQRYDGRRLDDRQRWNGQQRWDSGWRNDRRYDWQRYRSRYSNTYHLGRYNAPRGWSYGYRPFSVGIYLDDILYSNNYWLDDPYEYRLPPAYGSLRWVRYYDDAMLVDTRDGYVVDVIRDFFW